MKKSNIIVFALLFLAISVKAQEDYIPTKENLETRQWFEEARFGMFIHWGVYSVLGDGEWVMNNQNISIDEYGLLPSFFNPIAFNADEWVKIAKDAGMRYITITSRHHDGFSMFDSKISDYNIVQKTPYKKDVLKQLAEACKKEGIKLFFYYSLLDWHNDDYFPRGRTGRGISGRKEGDWNKYIAFMKAQLTELLTNYGEIAGIWFDGDWDQRPGPKGVYEPLVVDWHYDELYKTIHDLQPQCLIGNNRHLAPLKGEDFQMFERDLPGETKTGFGTKYSDVSTLPKEVCATINGNWGFNLQDRNHKSTKQLVDYLVKAAGYGSNLLLNVGPMPNGKIQPNHVASLKKVGDWLTKYGKTIYDTKAGTIKQGDAIVSTQKGKTLYLHLLEGQSGELSIPDFDGRIKNISFFESKERIKYSLKKKTLTFEIPENKKDPIDTIIEITLK